MIKIEAVTVCVGYGDILAETARKNMHFFDRWVVITSPRDEETFEVCRDLSIPCITTEDFYRDGMPFNKGRGVQRGINAISCSDWVLHIDADIVLPHTFPQMLISADLDPSCIYGCDRMMVRSWEDWQNVIRSGYRQHGKHCYVLPHPNYPIGTRWVSPRDGYVPIGFFQLFHGRDTIRKGFHHKPYPSHHGDATRADVQFALQWDRRQRVLLPEVIAWHLETERSPLGANWKGRKTPRFGPAT